MLKKIFIVVISGLLFASAALAVFQSRSTKTVVPFRLSKPARKYVFRVVLPDIAPRNLIYPALILTTNASQISAAISVGSSILPPQPQEQKVTRPVAAPLPWVPNSLTQPVPPGASKTRLSLPVPKEKLYLGFGAFGTHQGGHPEGLDHEWIEIENGTPVGSWADGEVYDVKGGLQHGSREENSEWRIFVDYGDGLIGEHMAVKTPLVQKGQKVKAGDPIAYGFTHDHLPGYHSGEFNLTDLYRRDGPLTERRGEAGVFVSSFDYLRDEVKKDFLQYFTAQVIEPYIAKGRAFGGVFPWEPYLTNPLFHHRGNEGKLFGEWYLVSKAWALDGTWDIISFLPHNPWYYPQQKVYGNDNAGGDYLAGTWIAEYAKNRVMIDSDLGRFYGIFEIDESQQRARMKLELQRNTYPEKFSENAVLYLERTEKPVREDL